MPLSPTYMMPSLSSPLCEIVLVLRAQAGGPLGPQTAVVPGHVHRGPVVALREIQVDDATLSDRSRRTIRCELASTAVGGVRSRILNTPAKL